MYGVINSFTKRMKRRVGLGNVRLRGGHDVQLAISKDSSIVALMQRRLLNIFREVNIDLHSQTVLVKNSHSDSCHLWHQKSVRRLLYNHHRSKSNKLALG